MLRRKTKTKILRSVFDKATLLSLSLIFLFPLTILSQQATPLVETGQFAEKNVTPPGRLKIVSYNVHGPQKDDIEKLFGTLERHPALRDAHVLALQEANRYRQKSGRRNIARELAERLKMNYVYAVENSYPESNGGGARGLAILSRLPLTDIERLELPHRGPGGRLRIGLFATVQVGATALRLCNTHLETRLAKEKKAEQMSLMVTKLKQSSPAQKMIVLGDFNTITDGTRKALAAVFEQHGFTTPLRGDEKTFQRYFVWRPTLDWVYLSNLRVLEHKVEEDVTASDHRPLWVVVDLFTAENAKSAEKNEPQRHK
jgi:endonuclease/exonuclease/phosphatase family metal-dependent hydrolase